MSMHPKIQELGAGQESPMYTYICTYIHRYVNIYMYTYIYMHTYTYECHCTQGSTEDMAPDKKVLYIYVYMHMQAQKFAHISVHAYIHSYIYIRMSLHPRIDRGDGVRQGSAGLGRFLEKGACFAGAKVAKQDFAEDRCTQRHRLYVCMCVCVLLHARVIPVCA